MATLMAVYNSEGCVGRCDANCFNAVHQDCECICQGANHGVGEALAIKQTAKRAEKWIADYAQARKIGNHEAEVFGTSVSQPALF